MSPPHIRQNLILVTSLFTGFGWSPPSSHAATQETLSSYNYIRSDLYQVAMDAGGVALKIAGLAGPHSSRSNRIPLDIRVTNNGTETRTFTVNSRFYRQPSIANGYGLGEKLRVLTPRTTPVLAPGQSHLFTGEDFQLSLMLFFNAPGGNTTNKVYNHSYPPAGFPAGSVPDDGVNIVLANTYGIGLRLANNGSARPSQVFDNANLEVSVTGEIPYGGSYGGSDGIARSLTLSTAGSLPNIHLFAVPSTAPDRAGATPEDALGGCSSCENTSICTTAALNSLNYTISFPTDNFNEARSFRLKADAPHPKLTDPSALQLDVDLGFKSILGTQTLGQITTSSQVALIDIASPDEYTINFYHIADAGATESGDRYLNPTGTPHTTVKVEDPDPGNGNNQVKITRTTGTDIEISRYTYEAATDTWQLAAADGQRIEKITSTQSQVIPEIETEDREVTDAAGNTISKVVADYNQFPFGRRMISQTIDPNGRALITTYAYYGDDDGVEEGDPGYGKLHHTTTPTGNWRHFEYDAPGRLIKSVTPHTDLSNTAADYDGSQDAALRVMDYIFDDFPTTPGAPQETQVTTVLGTEISRRYTVKHPDGEDNITTVTPEAAYDAPDNLVTKRRWITTNGTFKFDPTRIDFPDGTASFFTHTLDPTGQQKITIASTGKPSTDGLSIEKGTSTVTVTNRQGTVLNTNTTDIETGLQLSKTAATSIDAFGRATTNSFLDPADNSIATTSTNYDCCGIANTTDRSGIYTNYDNHDDLISSQTSLGIKTTSIADPTARTGGGRIESLTRTAVDGEGNEIAGSTTLLQRREYDAAGYLVKEYAPPINADTDPVVTDLAARRATEFTDLIDHASGHRTRTVTNPDGTTVISKSHAGGRLMKITGTGTHHSRFEYGVEVPAGTNLPAMRFTKTVLLKKDGTDSAEWSKSYTDQAGRTPLAVTSSGATATSTYNAFGQMISQTDPDGVTALFAYDERGRLEITAEDLDRDGIIDYDGTDRISKTATTVSQREVDGENLVTLLTTIIAWTTDGDATTTAELSRSESTTDGLHTWSSSEGLETHTTMAYAGNGNYTSTGTNSNGTSTENIVLGGRLRSITSFDNTGTPTTGTTYDYDDLGRASTVTDARNGPTTITYYADDRVKSTTTPDPDDADPGTGRTTSLSYDTAGRRKTITLPDHTSEAQKVI
ncbi:MAG: YD repeat-containing protein, partial [Verrucomicrobiales bacterium]